MGNGKQVQLKEVEKWITALDVNSDGKVTKEEVQKNGGDKYNILKWDASEEEKRKINNDIATQQLVIAVTNMCKGFNDAPDFVWNKFGIGKKIVDGFDGNSKPEKKQVLKICFQIRKYVIALKII